MSVKGWTPQKIIRGTRCPMLLWLGNLTKFHELREVVGPMYPIKPDDLNFPGRCACSGSLNMFGVFTPSPPCTGCSLPASKTYQVHVDLKPGDNVSLVFTKFKSVRVLLFFFKCVYLTFGSPHIDDFSGNVFNVGHLLPDIMLHEIIHICPGGTLPPPRRR